MSQLSPRELKDRQARKIEELRQSLSHIRHLTVREQAEVLGLGRSTAWVVLKCGYKSSGLTAAVINRMLLAPALPSEARIKIQEYITEKVAGEYGHNQSQRRRFLRRLSGPNAMTTGHTTSLARTGTDQLRV